MSAAPAPGRRSAFVAALTWILALSPFLLFLLTLPRLGEMPRNDYWGAFAQVLDGDRLSLDPVRWFEARINEHRVAVPLALWTVNAYASGGDDRVLRLVALLFLLATAVLLLRHLPLDVRSRPWRFAAVGLLVSAWLASPVAARSWAVGFIGTTWLLGNWIIVGAVVCFSRLLETPEGGRWPRRYLLGLAGLGLLGLFSLVTTLAVWPALCLGAVGLTEGRTRRRLVVVVGLLCALLFGLFLVSYEQPAAHRPPEFGPGEWLTFSATLLGQPFALESEVALVWGAAGLLFLAASVVWVLRRRPIERRRFAIGLLVALTAAGCALETAIGRAGGGELQPLSGRYGPIALLFWAGLTWAFGVLWVERFGAAPRRLAAGWLVGTAALLATLPVSRERLREELALARLQPLAELAVLWEVPDRIGLASVAAGTAQVSRSREFFESVGHKPFDDGQRWALGARFEAPVLQPDAAGELAGGVGRWNEFEEVSGDFARVSGSLPGGAPPLERVVFLSSDGRLCGGGVPLPLPLENTLRGKGSQRVRRAIAFRHGRSQAGRIWAGYLSRDCEPPVVALGEFVRPLGWRTLRATGSVGEQAERWLVR